MGSVVMPCSVLKMPESGQFDQLRDLHARGTPIFTKALIRELDEKLKAHVAPGSSIAITGLLGDVVALADHVGIT